MRNRQGYIREIAADIGCTKNVASFLLSGFVNYMECMHRARTPVAIPGFGTFTPRGPHKDTGNWTTAFRPSKALIENVNNFRDASFRIPAELVESTVRFANVGVAPCIARAAINSILLQVIDDLIQEDKASIFGLGKFRLVKKEETMFVNNLPGKNHGKVTIRPACHRVVFRAGVKMRTDTGIKGKMVKKIEKANPGLLARLFGAK